MDAHAKMVNLAEAGYKIATAPRRKPERVKEGIGGVEEWRGCG